MNEQTPYQRNRNQNGEKSKTGPIRTWFRDLTRSKNGEASARDVLEELIEEREDAEVPIDADERLLLANILELRGRTIHDVMVPRADIVAVECGTSLSDIVELTTRAGHSRLPIYRETLDDALGMMHIKDVLAWRGRDKEFTLQQIMRQVLFVPPSMQVLELLLEMRVKRCHMALVVDEYGGVDGLVTIEDLVEEIVGEIEDEHDAEDIDEEIITKEVNLLEVSASYRVDDLEKHFNVNLDFADEDEVETVGGLVFSKINRIPKDNEEFNIDDIVNIKVLRANERKILTVQIRKIIN